MTFFPRHAIRFIRSLARPTGPTSPLLRGTPPLLLRSLSRQSSTIAIDDGRDFPQAAEPYDRDQILQLLFQEKHKVAKLEIERVMDLNALKKHLDAKWNAERLALVAAQRKLLLDAARLRTACKQEMMARAAAESRGDATHAKYQELLTRHLQLQNRFNLCGVIDAITSINGVHGAQNRINKIAESAEFSASLEAIASLRMLRRGLLEDTIKTLHATLSKPFSGHSMYGNVGSLVIDTEHGQLEAVDGAALEAFMHWGGISYTAYGIGIAEAFTGSGPGKMSRELLTDRESDLGLGSAWEPELGAESWGCAWERF